MSYIREVLPYIGIGAAVAIAMFVFYLGRAIFRVGDGAWRDPDFYGYLWRHTKAKRMGSTYAARFAEYERLHRPNARTMQAHQVFEFSPDFHTQTHTLADLEKSSTGVPIKRVAGKLELSNVNEGDYEAGEKARIGFAIYYDEAGLHQMLGGTDVPNQLPHAWGDINLSRLSKKLGILHVLRLSEDELEYAYTPPK